MPGTLLGLKREKQLRKAHGGAWLRAGGVRCPDYHCSRRRDLQVRRWSRWISAGKQGDILEEETCSPDLIPGWSFCTA